MSSYPQVDFGTLPAASVPSNSSSLKWTPAAAALPDAATTLTADMVAATGILRGVLSAAAITTARTFTLPTAALLVAGISGCAVGTSLELNVVGDAADIATLAVGTGGTLAVAATGAVAAATSGRFVLRVTNVTSGAEAYTLTRVA